MADIKEIFVAVNETIISDIKKELELQGHYLTGALEASFKNLEIDEAGNIVLTAEALGYLEDLEQGIPASEIDIAAKFNEMVRYVNLRFGYFGSKANSVAYLILRKQAKEGMPTSGSYAFSKTGERTKAVEETFNNNDEKYTGMLDEAAIGSLDNEFSQTKSGVL